MDFDNVHPYFGGIQPEDADNVEKYPNECVQCFPAFDLGGNSGSSAHQNANPTGKDFLPWPPVGASISNVSPIACTRGSRPNLNGAFARTFRIAANVQKDYNTKVSGTNTGNTKLSKFECEKFASKYAIPFRVLWDMDKTSGGCWPYCIDLSTVPIGCIYDAAQDEVRYIEVDIPGFVLLNRYTMATTWTRPRHQERTISTTNGDSANNTNVNIAKSDTITTKTILLGTGQNTVTGKSNSPTDMVNRTEILNKVELVEKLLKLFTVIKMYTLR